ALHPLPLFGQRTNRGRHLGAWTGDGVASPRRGGGPGAVNPPLLLAACVCAVEIPWGPLSRVSGHSGILVWWAPPGDEGTGRQWTAVAVGRLRPGDHDRSAESQSGAVLYRLPPAVCELESGLTGSPDLVLRAALQRDRCPGESRGRVGRRLDRRRTHAPPNMGACPTMVFERRIGRPRPATRSRRPAAADATRTLGRVRLSPSRKDPASR